jgi:hypothetical protein
MKGSTISEQKNVKAIEKVPEKVVTSIEKKFGTHLAHRQQ